MTDHEDFPNAITRLLGGDLSQMASLREVPHEELRAETRGTTFVASANSVARVLTDYRDGRVPKALAQEWASFVKRGYFESVTKLPVTSIDIDWETEHEDAMAEALMRLDELGDVVDGELRPGEADQLLAALRM